MRLMVIEICTRNWLRDVAERLSRGEFTLAAVFSGVLRIPEAWFIHAALGVVLLVAGLSVWSIRRRRLNPARTEAVKSAGELYEAIFHALPYPAFCKDASGGYLAVNRAYEDTFGIEARRLIGRDLTQTRHLRLDCDRTHAAHLRIIRAAQPVSDDVLLFDVRHGVRPFRLRLTPMRAGGTGAALLGIVVAADHPLEAAQPGRSAADAALDYALLTAISHDVRTPLTGIIGTLELLGYSELTARQRALVENADIASRSLQGILDDVLALAKLETGVAVLDHHPFDLRGLLAGLLAQHQAGPRIELSVDERVAPLLMGDSSSLRQALDKVLAHFLSRRPDTAPQLQVRMLGQGTRWQSLELVLSAQAVSPAMARREFSDEAHHGDELAWISACKLCEWMGLSLREQGSGGSDLCLVMQGRMMVAAHDLPLAQAGAVAPADPLELAGLAKADAAQVMQRLADVFGDDASAVADYLQLVRNEQERLLANLDGCDAPRLREIAHYLCGMGSFFGARRLSELAHAIELGLDTEVPGHAQVLSRYLTGFIDSLHGKVVEAAETSKNTISNSDISHGNLSGAALEL